MSVNFNESFKALVREVFQEKSEGVIHILDEVVSNKASEDTKSINNLKELAIKDIKGEIATNDFVRAEIAELKTELKQDITDLRAELKQDNAKIRNEMAELRAELKQDIADLRAEFSETLNTKVAILIHDNANLKAKLKDEMAKRKADIKWIIGLQFAFFCIFVGIILIF